MLLEKKWQSKNGRAFFHIGGGQLDAVGTPKPSEEFPIGEGLRLLFAKAVDRLWLYVCAVAALHRLTGRRKKRKK